jgi:hypothetical protein
MPRLQVDVHRAPDGYGEKRHQHPRQKRAVNRLKSPLAALLNIKRRRMLPFG